MSAFRMAESMRVAVASFLLMATLGLGLAPSSLVLCFEPDGCVSLEFSRDGSSCWDGEGHPDAASREADRSALKTADLHCELCTDLPLGAGAIWTPSASTRLLIQEASPPPCDLPGLCLPPPHLSRPAWPRERALYPGGAPPWTGLLSHVRLLV